MIYLWVFIAGGVFVLTSAAAGLAVGWFGFERYVHKPRLAEIRAHQEGASNELNKQV